MALHSIDPATGDLLALHQEHSPEQVTQVLASAAATQRDWRHTSFTERSRVLRRVADVLRGELETHGTLIAREMGKPIVQARAEIEKCASCCDFFAEHGERFLRDEEIATEATRSFVTFQPLGVLLAIMPWNFPFWQAFRAAVPSLMAGNAVLLKHAANVSGCALAIESVFRTGGVPEHVFTSLLVPSARVAELIASPHVAAVTLTGSTEAGRAVAAEAGRHLKKCVLELGGSDAYVVLEDADLEQAVAACVTSRLINSGQSCIAAKRFIVARSVRPAFEEMFVAKMRLRRVGAPLVESTAVGPLARTDLRDALHEQVRRSVQAGAQVLLGGNRIVGPGAFYEPTVLSLVTPGMAAFDEETFGPVAALVEAADEKQAIALANKSVFGLGAAVFTRDLDRGERVAAQIEAGCCFINDFVRSDPRLPFGGIKASGFGRELSELGIREFVNAKTVVMK